MTASIRPPRHRIEQRAVTWWVLRALLRLGVPSIVLAVVAALWTAGRPWVLLVLALTLLALVVQAVVAPRWRYAVHRWETTDDAVYALTGWYVREWRVAPLSRIQTVDAVRGPLEQALGLATLRVTTASSSGAIKIVGLDHDLAAQVADRLTAVTERVPGDAT